jgi:predicted nucleic acid-binding protein
MSRAVWLDANVILRFLRNDDEKLTPVATALFQKAVAGKVLLYVSAVTLSEVFYGLTSFYKVPHRKAAEILLSFVRSDVAKCEKDLCLVDALGRVIAHDVDFGDAYLAACAVNADERIATFDKDFRKFKDVRIYAEQE